MTFVTYAAQTSRTIRRADGLYCILAFRILACSVCSTGFVQRQLVEAVEAVEASENFFFYTPSENVYIILR